MPKMVPGTAMPSIVPRSSALRPTNLPRTTRKAITMLSKPATTVAKTEGKPGDKDADGKTSKPPVTAGPGKEQSAVTPKGAEDGVQKNGAAPTPPPLDLSGEPSLEQDVQLQKAVELLKTWKIFKELRPS